jgi:hypothetical protein
MKRFFWSLCRFGSAVLPVCIFLCLIYRTAFRSTFKHPVADFNSRNISILILGDSHPYYSILTDDWKEAFGFAYFSEGPDYTLAKLQLLSERCPGLQTVVIGYGCHTPAYYATGFPAENHYDICFNLHPFLGDTKIPPDNPLAPTLREVYLNYTFGLVTGNSIPKIKYTLSKHLFAPRRPPAKNGTHINWETRINEHYCDEVSHELKPPSRSVIAELYNIRDFCLQKGYRLVLFSAPVPKPYFDHIPPPYKQLADSVVKSLCDHSNTFYLDYSQYPLPDSCFFDGDHTNLYGAGIITPLLRDTLVALKITPPRDPF